MKRILATALVLALTAGIAQAQKTDGQHRQKKEMHKKHQGMMNDLNLTEDQKTRLKALHEARRQEMQAIRGNSSLTADQAREQRKALHQKYRSQFESILTPEQKARVAKAKEERKAKMTEMKRQRAAGENISIGERRAAGKGAYRKSGSMRYAGDMRDLNLTADQQERMKQLRTDFRAQMEALRNDQSLTPEQKRTRVQELAKKRQEQMKSILTKEQVEKIEAKKAERKKRISK